MVSKDILTENVCSGILNKAPNQEIYQYNSLYQQIEETNSVNIEMASKKVSDKIQQFQK